MLREEVERYSELTGEDGWSVPIIKIGAYLDGYDKGIEDARRMMGKEFTNLTEEDLCDLMCGDPEEDEEEKALKMLIVGQGRGGIMLNYAPCNTHELKILPKWFEDVRRGDKDFEIRRADRDYNVGDFLILQEYERGRYTGRYVIRKIKYIYKGDGTYGLNEDFWILGMEIPEDIASITSGDTVYAVDE